MTVKVRDNYFSEERFNNSTYDGIVLEIPAMFINSGSSSDKIKEKLAELAELFLDNEFSCMHPSWYLNTNEILRWKNKKEIIRRKEEDIKEKEKRYKEYMDAKIRGDYYETEWVTKHWVISDSYTVFGEDIIENEGDAFTKSGFKVGFKKIFLKYLSDKNITVIEWLKQNPYIFPFLEEDEYFIKIDEEFPFYIDTYGNICIRYKQLYLLIVSQSERNGKYYHQKYMIEVRDGKYTIPANNTIDLSDYELTEDKRKFVKKQNKV